MKHIAGLVTFVFVLAGVSVFGFNPLNLVTGAEQKAAAVQASKVHRNLIVVSNLGGVVSWDASTHTMVFDSNDRVVLPEGSTVYQHGNVLSAGVVDVGNVCVQFPNIVDGVETVSHFTTTVGTIQDGVC